jgi:hypothetical protein
LGNLFEGFFLLDETGSHAQEPLFVRKGRFLAGKEIVVAFVYLERRVAVWHAHFPRIAAQHAAYGVVVHKSKRVAAALGTGRTFFFSRRSEQG